MYTFFQFYSAVDGLNFATPTDFLQDSRVQSDSLESSLSAILSAMVGHVSNSPPFYVGWTNNNPSYSQWLQEHYHKPYFVRVYITFLFA